MGKKSNSNKLDALQIKTPQALIHIRHNISLLQYKYWVLMLRDLRRQFDEAIPPDENGFRSLSMSVITEALGYAPNKTQLWNDLKELKNETIAFNVLSKDGGEGKYGAGFISEWKVTSNRVDYKLPSFIEEVVRGLDAPKAIFHMLQWDIFNHFSGKYEAIIYKLCRDYRNVKKTPYFDLDKFRHYMGLGPTEYKEFRDLNKFVISSPVKAINQSEVSDLTLSVDFERQGRKVVGLRFLIESKAQSVIPFTDSDDADVFKFAKVHIDPGTQKKYLSIRSEVEIAQCIERANAYGEQQVKKGKEANYGALYRTAITDGWHVQQQEKLELEKEKKQKKKIVDDRISAKEKEEAEENRKVADSIANALSEFAALSPDQQDEIRERFRATITVIAIRKSFDKQGEHSPLVRTQFAEFFHINFPTLG